MPVEIISRFAIDDVEVSALHARAFGGDPTIVTPWAERLKRHALTWIGAFDGDRLIGFVQVCWDGGEHAFVLDTAVDPGWQRQGVATSLVRSAADDATAAGCAWLHVDFEPHLTGFYLDRCGFRSTAAGLLPLRPS